MSPHAAQRCGCHDGKQYARDVRELAICRKQTPSQAGAVLLRRCFFIQPSADREGLRGQDILIEGNRISRIAEGITAAPGARVIDCSRHVVVPGFVNTHHHFFQTLTRNLPAVQNAKLFDWLVYLYEVWKNIDEEAIYTSSLLAMGELLKTGCTCSTDHLYLYPRGAGISCRASSRRRRSWGCAFLRRGAPCR